jgi:hypothetical protein
LSKKYLSRDTPATAQVNFPKTPNNTVVRVTPVAFEKNRAICDPQERYFPITRKLVVRKTREIHSGSPANAQAGEK